MKPCNLHWMHLHQYNKELVEQLIHQAMDAIEYDSSHYLAWVSDSTSEGGTIEQTGIVKDDSTLEPVPFLYPLSALRHFVERCNKRADPSWVPETIIPGQRVVASITNEFRPRGAVGTAVEERVPAWPAAFGVKWDHSNTTSVEDVGSISKVV